MVSIANPIAQKGLSTTSWGRELLAHNLYCYAPGGILTMVSRCPVCGEALKDQGAVLEFNREERRFKFCCLECLRIFQQYPEAYEGAELPQIEAVEDSGI